MSDMSYLAWIFEQHEVLVLLAPALEGTPKTVRTAVLLVELGLTGVAALVGAAMDQDIDDPVAGLLAGIVVSIVTMLLQAVAMHFGKYGASTRTQAVCILLGLVFAAIGLCLPILEVGEASSGSSINMIIYTGLFAWATSFLVHSLHFVRYTLGARRDERMVRTAMGRGMPGAQPAASIEECNDDMRTIIPDYGTGETSATPLAPVNMSESNQQVARPTVGQRSRALPRELIQLDRTPENKLGEGGVGVVWYGHYQGQEVAIKELRAEASDKLRMFLLQEMAIQSTLSHANIVKVIGMSVEGESMLLVQEYCPLRSLKDVLGSHLRTQLKNDWSLRKRFALDGALGMAYLHSKNVLHLDIKTLNFMVTEDLRVKVGDFGISTVLQQDATSTVHSKGWTVRYVAPEVMMGQSFGKPADVYSYSMVLYELFAMKVPWSDFRGPKEALLGMIAAGKRPPVPRSLPQSHRNILQRCWAHDPKQRCTFPELVQMLENLQ